MFVVDDKFNDKKKFKRLVLYFRQFFDAHLPQLPNKINFLLNFRYDRNVSFLSFICFFLGKSIPTCFYIKEENKLQGPSSLSIQFCPVLVNCHRLSIGIYVMIAILQQTSNFELLIKGHSKFTTQRRFKFPT